MQLKARTVVGVVVMVLRFDESEQLQRDPEGIEAISRWLRSQWRRYHRKTGSYRMTDPGRVEAWDAANPSGSIARQTPS
jgi:hypothetical protein